MARTVADLGEFGVIARIERAAARLAGSRVALGIGDDAAVLRPPAGQRLLVSTDALVEGVHFLWRSWAPRTVGRRAVVAALSDLAAMGARPLGWTLALAVPATLPVATLDGLVRGLVFEATRHGAPLVGGNVTRASQTSLTLTVLGAAAPGRILTRRGARAGDRILVTGCLGAAALQVALSRRSRGRVRHVGEPRLAAGRALARVSGVGGCIDVSDGLDADLAHLLEAGERRLGARIDPQSLPLPRGFEGACRRARLDPERLARSGGEDYELLFTLRPNGPSAAVLARRLKVAVSEIGTVTDRPRGPRGPGPGAAAASGWRHF
jgi:thiamine-monophosphate kinase